jgi:energy-coupling factor transporter transmembrane protein EcfT
LEIGFGILGIYIWGIALVFLILTLKFRNRKIGKWMFGSITFILVMLPFIILFSWKSNQNNQKSLYKTQKNKYSGIYFCDSMKESKFVLNLKNNDTFTFAVDSCNAGHLEGRWELVKVNSAVYIDFYPSQNYLDLGQAQIIGQKLIFFNPIPFGCYPRGELILIKNNALK